MSGFFDFLPALGNIVSGAGNIAAAISGGGQSAPAPAPAPVPTTQAQAFNSNDFFSGATALVLASRLQPAAPTPAPAALSSPATVLLIAGGIVLVALIASR